MAAGDILVLNITWSRQGKRRNCFLSKSVFTTMWRLKRVMELHDMGGMGWGWVLPSWVKWLNMIAGSLLLPSKVLYRGDRLTGDQDMDWMLRVTLFTCWHQHSRIFGGLLKRGLSCPKDLSETTFWNNYFLSFHLLRARLGALKMTAISWAVI